MSFLDGLLGKPSPDKFARIMTKALQQAGTSDPIAYDAKEFVLRVGNRHVINLRNYFDEYRAVPMGRRRAYLARVSSIVEAPELPDALDDVRDALVPRIRERSFYELLPLQIEQNFSESDRKKLPAFRPMAEFFAIGVAADFPDRISEISAEQLEKWGIGFEEALEVGRENLWKRSVGKWQPIAEGVWMSPWQDNLDVNRLALPTLFRQLTVDGDPVAFAPNRDHLIVTGSRDIVGQGVAAACANSMLDEPRPIDATPIILDGLEWKPYEFDESHPVAPLFRRLRLRSLVESYGSQKNLLEAKFEREQKDIFVATFLAFENKEKKVLRSVATWTETVDTLLPRADTVLLNASTGSEEVEALGEVRWERLVEIVGHRMERQEGMYPERYRVTTFPTVDEIERLGLGHGD